MNGAGETAEPAGERTLRQRLMTAVRVLFAVAVVVAVVYATVTQWAGVQQYLRELSWPALLLSLAMVLLGTVAATLGFRSALASVGYQVPVSTASQIYLIGLLAKYVPGSVWSFVLQMELGKRAAIPRSRPFVASLVLTGLSTAVALSLGLFGLPALFEVGRAVAIAVIALVPIALVCSHPKVLSRLVSRMLRLLRRPELEREFTWREVGSMAGWCLVAWLCFGVHLWLLAGSEAAPGFEGMLRCVAAISLGLTAGIFAFLSPSGLGVREAIIVAALLPYVPPAMALGMALVSRLVFTLADVIAAGAAALSGFKPARATA